MRSGLNRLRRRDGIIVHREQYYFCRKTMSANLARDFDAASRHRDIEYRRLRAQLTDKSESFVSVGRFPDNRDVFDRSQQLSESLPEHRMIVCNHDSNHLSAPRRESSFHFWA